jgi:hypothetical protein
LAAPIGIRVDNAKLLDLNAYLVSLPAPEGAQVDAQVAAHGREVFRTMGCTSCQNVDQGKPVPAFIVPMKTIFPGDNPVVLAQRMPPLNPTISRTHARRLDCVSAQSRYSLKRLNYGEHKGEIRETKA